jgi:hypothetical protein
MQAFPGSLNPPRRSHDKENEDCARLRANTVYFVQIFDATVAKLSLTAAMKLKVLTAIAVGCCAWARAGRTAKKGEQAVVERRSTKTVEIPFYTMVRCF